MGAPGGPGGPGGVTMGISWVYHKDIIGIPCVYHGFTPPQKKKDIPTQLDIKH